MILFGASVSPFVRKVLMAAAEKGITLDHKPVAPHDADPAFKAASPTGKIPALQDGDYTLADSSAIVHYLEAVHPDKPLIPAAARARGKVIWFEEYADTVMFALGTVIFVNRALLPKLRKVPGDLAAADQAIAKLPTIFNYLEAQLSEQGYLVGDAITLADIAITCQLINLGHADVTVDAAQYPKLAAYFARMVARPSVAALVALEKQMMGG
jgi:glutathione S-transferase